LISENARAVLPLETAVRLRDTLDRAIEAALGGSAQQPGLWSPATVRAAAARFGRRAA
jgi:hypothetical protein